MSDAGDPDFTLSKRSRRKSHPLKSVKVWDYFVDLKSSTGFDRIKCRHCDFETSDRAPLTLTTHIKRHHSDGASKGQKMNSLASGLRGNMPAGVFEELSKHVAAFGSVTMDKNDIVGLLQSFANKVDSKDGTSLEDLVNALGVPSTSTNQLACGSSPASNGSFGTPHNYSAAKNSKDLDDWVFVATYTDQKDVEAARNAGKVVRHSYIQTKEGSKVKYRCNQWKRTHCPYRMHYVEADGIYTLYEKGQHEHTPLPTQPPPAIDESHNPYLGTDYLQSIISHAIHATASLEPKKEPPLVISEFSSAASMVIEEPPKIETNSSPCLTLPENLLNVFHEAVRAESSETFTLSSGIANLLQVATELQLTFTFNSRIAAEFCFSKPKSSNPHQMVVFVDEGNEVIVKLKQNDIVASEERWRKADAPQFLWAVRGILAKHFND